MNEITKPSYANDFINDISNDMKYITVTFILYSIMKNSKWKSVALTLRAQALFK